MKTKKWLFFVLLFLVLLFVVFYYFLGQTQTKKAEGSSLYQNPILRIQFEYPAEWTAQSSGHIQGYPTQYKGKSGFFVVNAIPAHTDLSETTDVVLADNCLLFGEKPVKEECIVHSRVGYYLYPEDTLTIGENHPICYVTQLSNPAYYNGQTCTVLTIFSDKEHIRELVNSLQPYYPY
ncbi:MAG: hypothetical protein PHI40_00480 [Caldisericia bacterium]|nr:hypothetical protein [Caldisericia bacterium]MDD4613876.1 hypothetical protein [Caldisericia bacterium]